MRPFMTALLLLLCTGLYSQSKPPLFTAHNFDEQILTYKPMQSAGVSDQDFRKGCFYLDEVVRATEGKPEKLLSLDYWNILMAFIKLQEPKAHLELAFQKAIGKDALKICEVLEAFGEKSEKLLQKHIPEQYQAFIGSCGQQQKPAEEFQPGVYAQARQLDPDLIGTLYQVSQRDQRYRGQEPVDWAKQRQLDEQNLLLIDSLYQHYGCYIGKRLAGERLSSVMWLVIQHSNIRTMERYLPIVHAAVTAGDLAPTPLKMLLDRIHAIKYQYQFFGSQVGVALASEEQCSAIRRKYGLD